MAVEQKGSYSSSPAGSPALTPRGSITLEEGGCSGQNDSDSDYAAPERSLSASESTRNKGSPKIKLRKQRTASFTSLTEVSPENLATSTSSTELIRRLVSKKKRRFVKDGFDLDLTYITDRILAMGFPSQKFEAVYRNDMKKIIEFFHRRHKDSFMVYNLCSERDYDHSLFNNQVRGFPFDDHNCPAFDDMPIFCEGMDEWLCENTQNVAALHCKAGKGRTGLMICVYLLHTGMWQKAKDALAFYGYARTRNQKGVTIPSQRRWVYYYEKYTSLRDSGSSLPPTRPLTIKKFYISEKAPSFDSFIVTCKYLDKRYSSKKLKHRVKKRCKEGGCQLNCGSSMQVQKDVRVEFSKYTLGVKSRVFSFWFNTDFIENNRLRLSKPEIDKVNKDKSMKDFWLEVNFEEPDEDSDLKSDSDLWEDENKDASDMFDEELEEIGAQMLDGLKIKNRSWKLRTFQKVFIGHEAVVWMLQENKAQTKTKAVALGEAMLRKGVFVIVRTTENTRDIFENGCQFYRFREHASDIVDEEILEPSGEDVGDINGDDDGPPDMSSTDSDSM